MFIVGTVIAGLIAWTIVASTLRSPSHSRSHAARTSAMAALAAMAMLLAGSGTAQAAIVPTVGLGTAANYSVLAGTTITNTGPSTLALSAGVSPGAAVVGFPPGSVGGVIDAANAPALQAQTDLIAAYDDAAGRPINATQTSELGGLTLVGGVYSGPSKSPLTLTGTLTLDAQGDPTTVFIFQTDSTLITASSSTVNLINGAQECNVFWQVGSSATLGTGSTFVGNILALTSISVTTGVTVHGRALARNGAVTLDNDVFTTPTCDLTPIATTTTAVAATTLPSTVTTPPPPLDTLPATGTGTGTGGLPVVAGASLAVGLVAVLMARRRPVVRR